MSQHELKYKPLSALDSLEKGRDFIFSALTSHYRIMGEVDAHIKLIRRELTSISAKDAEIKLLREALENVKIRGGNMHSLYATEALILIDEAVAEMTNGELPIDDLEKFRMNKSLHLPKFEIGQCVEYGSGGIWDDVVIQEVIPYGDTFKYKFNGNVSSGLAHESSFRKIVIGGGA